MLIQNGAQAAGVFPGLYRFLTRFIRALYSTCRLHVYAFVGLFFWLGYFEVFTCSVLSPMGTAPSILYRFYVYCVCGCTRYV